MRRVSFYFEIREEMKEDSVRAYNWIESFPRCTHQMLAASFRALTRSLFSPLTTPFCVCVYVCGFFFFFLMAATNVKIRFEFHLHLRALLFSVHSTCLQISKWREDSRRAFGQEAKSKVGAVSRRVSFTCAVLSPFFRILFFLLFFLWMKTNADRLLKNSISYFPLESW